MTPYIEGLIHMYVICGTINMLIAIRTKPDLLINKKTGKRYNLLTSLIIILLFYTLWGIVFIYFSIKGKFK